MGIYRTFQVSFWDDRKIEEDFTRDDMDVFIYLLLNAQVNLSGCYEIGLNRIARESKVPYEDVIKAMDRLMNIHRVIDYSEETKEVLIINWYKHNWTTSKDYIKGLKKHIDNVKDKQFKEYLENRLKELEDRRSTEGVKTVYRGCKDGGGTTNTNTNTISNSYSSKRGKNKFCDFPQTEYDFDEYEKELLGH